jgi:hypothetical protein
MLLQAVEHPCGFCVDLNSLEEMRSDLTFNFSIILKTDLLPETCIPEISCLAK